MTIKLQFMSDLHLETPDSSYDLFDITPQAPYLALLGDIGYVRDRQKFFDFLVRHLKKFEIVFLVLGNHEAWHLTWDDAKELVRGFEQEISQKRQSTTSLGKFVLLDRDVYHLHGPEGESVAILGCSLFSRVPTSSMKTVSFRINDFYTTDDWTVEEHASQFEGDLNWLNEQVSLLHGSRIAVLTHYSPTLDSRATDPRHKDSPIQSNFASDLSKERVWLSEDVKVWAFGHTHYNLDYVDEETGKRVVTNQRGYYGSQSTGFDEGKVLEL